MSRFNTGDKVRIREFQEEFNGQSPGFTPAMRDLCGEVFVIKEISYGYVYHGVWRWNDDWLELVEEEEEFDADIDVAAFEAIIT